MTARPLNTTNRQKIILAALAAAFSKREEALRKEENGLADLIYRSAFKPALLAKLKAVPEEWLTRRHGVAVNCAGERHALEFGPDDWRPIPVTMSHNTYPEVLSLNGERDVRLSDKIRAHARAKEELKAQRKLAMNELEILLSQFRTVETLATAWPAGKPFYKDIPFPAQLPVVQIETVNARLGLI